VTEKTVAQKMMMKPGRVVRLIQPPPDVFDLLGPLPEGATLVDDSAGAQALLRADIIVLFAENRTALEALLPGARTALNPDGMIWIVYRKGGARGNTDIHRDSIDAYAVTLGLKAVAIISVNQEWSALRFKASQ
jgi:hypothetical protein